MVITLLTGLLEGEAKYCALTSIYDAFINGVSKYTIAQKHVPFVKLGLGYSNYTIDEICYDDKEQAYNYGYHLAIGYEYKVNQHHSILASYDYYKTFENNEAKNDGITFPTDDTYHMNYLDVNLAYKYSF